MSAGDDKKNKIDSNSNIIRRKNPITNEAVTLEDGSKKNKITYVMSYSGNLFLVEKQEYQLRIISYDNKKGRFYVTSNSNDHPAEGYVKFLVAPELTVFFEFFRGQYEKYTSLDGEYDKATIIYNYVNGLLKEMETFFSAFKDPGLNLQEFEKEKKARAFILDKQVVSSKTDKPTVLQLSKKVEIYFSLKKLDLIAKGNTTRTNSYTAELGKLQENLKSFKKEDSKYVYSYVQNKIGNLKNAAKDKLKKLIEDSELDDLCKAKMRENVDSLAIEHLSNIFEIDEVEFNKKAQKLNTINKYFQIIKSIHNKISNELVSVTGYNAEKEKIDKLLSLYELKVTSFELIGSDGKIGSIEQLEEETLKSEREYNILHHELTVAIKNKFKSNCKLLETEVQDAVFVDDLQAESKLLLEKIAELLKMHTVEVDSVEMAHRYIQIKKEAKDHFIKNENFKKNIQFSIAQQALTKYTLMQQQKLMRKKELTVSVTKKIAELDQLKAELQKLPPFSDDQHLESLEWLEVEKASLYNLEALLERPDTNLDYIKTQLDRSKYKHLEARLETAQEITKINVLEKEIKRLKLLPFFDLKALDSLAQQLDETFKQAVKLGETFEQAVKLDKTLKQELPENTKSQLEFIKKSYSEHKKSFEEYSLLQSQKKNEFSIKFTDSFSSLNEICKELNSKAIELQKKGQNKGGNSLESVKSKILFEAMDKVNELKQSTVELANDLSKLQEVRLALSKIIDKSKDTLARQRNWYSYFKSKTASEAIIDKLSTYLKQLDIALPDVYKEQANSSSNTVPKRLY